MQNKAKERASPGYYEATFDGLATARMVAAGPQAGIHQYSFDGGAKTPARSSRARAQDQSEPGPGFGIGGNLAADVAAGDSAGNSASAGEMCGVLVDVCHTALGDGTW